MNSTTIADQVDAMDKQLAEIQACADKYKTTPDPDGYLTVDHWGDWHLRRSAMDPRMAYLVFAPREYSIDIGRLDTVAKVHEWLVHLSMKNWFHGDTLASFVVATKAMQEKGSH